MARKHSDQDLRRLESYNKILQTCKGKQLNFTRIGQLITNISISSIVRHCNFLASTGYLSTTEMPAGKHNKIVDFYTTVIDQYLLDDLESISEKIRFTKIVNGTITKASTEVAVKEINPNLRKINVQTDKDLQAKHKQQDELNRKAQKSPKNYISGSILSAAV